MGKLGTASVDLSKKTDYDTKINQFGKKKY